MMNVIIAIVGVIVGVLGSYVFKKYSISKGTLYRHLAHDEIVELIEEHEEARDVVLESAREVIWKATDNEMIEMFDENLKNWKAARGM